MRVSVLPVHRKVELPRRPGGWGYKTPSGMPRGPASGLASGNQPDLSGRDLATGSGTVACA
jgi:hypothetical protein